MGVTITATNAKYCFDMGSGGFFNLRKNIALALDEDFGRNYEQIAGCFTKEQYAENDRTAEKIINEKHLEDNYENVLDFLYMSDVEGEVSYQTCKQIYDLIKDIDYGKLCFRYAAHAHNDYEEFKEFLKDCYSHHKKMQWY